MSFKSLGRRCPVCNGARKDCRESTSSGLIHCRTDNPSTDYVLMGMDKIGFGMYIHSLELNRQEREREENLELFLLKKRKEREARERERQEQLARYRESLTIEERDKEFRKILNGLNLTESDYKSLIERGFTNEQIDFAMYRSVSQWQKLPYSVNDGLPGVKVGGKSLIVHSDGILCPIFNRNGLIIGMQIRYHNALMSGKYNWLAGEKKRKHRPTSHLRNGELPIGYYQSNLESPIPLIPLPSGITNPVILSEGTSIKPYRISIRTGITTIGASGGSHYNSPEQLKAYLEHTNPGIVLIAADASSRSNKNVLSQYQKTKELVENWGYKVLILWWRQDTKEVGDLDECSDERLAAINYLTWENFCPETKEEFFRDSEPSNEEYDAIIKEMERLGEIDRLSGEFEAKRDFFQYFSDLIHRLGKKASKYLKISRSKLRRTLRDAKKADVLYWNRHLPLPRPGQLEKLPPKIFFEQGDRLYLITALIHAGWGYILDSSPTGTGKSHDAASIVMPEGTMWYADQNHRNPSINEIKNKFTDLFPRHEGIILDADGKYRLAKTDEEKENPTIESNCFRTSLFSKLAKKGYNPNAKVVGDQNPICASCPAFKTFVKIDDDKAAPKCAASPDDGSGYKYWRRFSLSANYIRGHHLSFPEPLDLSIFDSEEATQSNIWDYSKDIIIWEEFARLVSGTKILHSSKADISEWFDLVWDLLPEIYQKISPLRQSLIHLFNNPKDIPRYGYNHDDLVSILPKIHLTEDEIKKIQSLQTIEDKIVIPEHIKYSELKDVSKGSINVTNREFARQAIRDTYSNFEEMPTNILPIFLSVLGGFESGALRLSKNSITVTRADTRTATIAAAAKSNLLLDSTSTIDNVSARLRVDKKAIINIEQVAPPLDNLEIIHVNMAGFGSNEYSESGLTRLSNAIQAIKTQYEEDTPVIGLKKYREKLGFSGHWFNESRGSNDFEGKETMIFAGSPNTNVGAAEDEYYTWYSTLEGFEDYYGQLQQNEIIQGIGRPRANRYRDSHFRIFFLATNLDLSWVKDRGMKLTSMEALELTPDAASESQLARYILLQGAAEFAKTGKAIEKIRQKDLAEITGKTQNAVQKLCAKFGENADGERGWSAMRKELKAIVKNLRLLFNKDTKEPGVSEILAVAKSNSMFAQWLDMDRVEFIEEFTKFIDGMDFEAFKEISFDDPSHTLVEKIRFFFAIIGLFPMDDLEFLGFNFQDWEKNLFSSA